MKNIDLHTHTTASGYEKTPSEVLQKMEEKKLAGGAITDHHSVKGLREVVENKEKRKIFTGAIVPSIEIGALYLGTQLDVLGYGIDYRKMDNNKKVASQLLTLPQVDKLFTDELNEVLRKFGIRVDPNDSYENHLGVLETAFKQLSSNYSGLMNSIAPNILSKDRAYFVAQVINNPQSPLKIDLSNFRMPIGTAVDIIRECDGKAILAHPFLYGNKAHQIIEQSVNIVDGYEVFHPSASKQQQIYLYKFCKDNKKIITGGSDYRSDNPESNVGFVGSQKVSAKLLDQFGDKLL